MVDVFDIPWARGQRQREVRALREGERGPVNALYDVERRRVVSVPLEYVWHIRDVVSWGGLATDDDSARWLASEDILTWDEELPGEPRPGQFVWSGAGGDLGWISIEAGVVHCLLPGRMLSSDWLGTDWFGGAGSTVVFHLDLEPLANPQEIAQQVRQGLSWGRSTEREVSFSLSGNLCEVRALPDDLLQDPLVAVRVQDYRASDASLSPRGANCGAPADGLRRLIDWMGDRLTVQVGLGAGDDLLEVWHWARHVGLQRLDATRIKTTHEPDGLGPPLERRRHRQDMRQICEEMFAALKARRSAPLLFVPALRVVQKQMAASARVAPATIVALIRGGVPVPVQSSNTPARPGRTASERSGTASTPGRCGSGREVSAEERCPTCWARNLCQSSTVGGASDGRRLRPRADLCDLWEVEIEAGLRLYSRLRDEDPVGLCGCPTGWGGFVRSAAVGSELIRLAMTGLDPVAVS